MIKYCSTVRAIAVVEMIQEYEKTMFYPTLIFNLDKQLFIMGDSGFPSRDFCFTPFRRAASLHNQEFADFNYTLSKMRVRVEHLFGRIKNRWRFLMYTSRLKSGIKNTIIIECIFIINNICLLTSDNGNIRQYVDANEGILNPEMTNENLHMADTAEIFASLKRTGRI